MEVLRQAVRRHADAHADDGLIETPVEGLCLFRMRAPSGMMRAMYKPLLCLVLQGAKQVAAGSEVHDFVAGRSLIVSADRPVVGRVVRASPHEPYLALSIDLDMAVMREVAAEIGAHAAAAPAAAATAEPAPEPEPALLVGETEEAVADCALRLTRLLDRPEAAAVLSPSIAKELHYWLLTGQHGASIRRLAVPGGHAQRVARAVAILRAEFASPVPVERLAAAAGMSPSTFHQHFKAVTSLSPRQFHKQLRLIEARRLMTSLGLTASRAAFAVGYESVSQFTRDYARMFGAPPRRDAGRARAAA